LLLLLSVVGLISGGLVRASSCHHSWNWICVSGLCVRVCACVCSCVAENSIDLNIPLDPLTIHWKEAQVIVRIVALRSHSLILRFISNPLVSLFVSSILKYSK
jgi:hypothetical protein